jgi:hypothetical protein
MQDTFDIRMSDGVVKIPLDFPDKQLIVDAVVSCLPTFEFKCIDLLKKIKV